MACTKSDMNEHLKSQIVEVVSTPPTIIISNSLYGSGMNIMDNVILVK